MALGVGNVDTFRHLEQDRHEPQLGFLPEPEVLLQFLVSKRHSGVLVYAL